MARSREGTWRRETLQADPWFAGLAEATRAELLRCASARRCTAGEPILRRGESADGLWVCAAGAVRLGWSAPGGRPFNFAYLPAGSWFGETALHADAGCDYDAHAQGRSVVVLHVARAHVLRVAQGDPGLREGLLQLAARRVAVLQDMLMDARSLTLVPRLAKTLLALVREHGSPAGPGELRLAQDRLAESLGSSRQSVNKALKAMERGGAIEVLSRRVVVRDAHALLDIARYG
jgi:CRP-like cAMP-binding protein